MCIQEKLKFRKFFLTVAVQKSVQNLLAKDVQSAPFC